MLALSGAERVASARRVRGFACSPPARIGGGDDNEFILVERRAQARRCVFESRQRKLKLTRARGFSCHPFPTVRFRGREHAA
jgi:hypothetical protein